jgi:tight adherence protein B
MNTAFIVILTLVVFVGVLMIGSLAFAGYRSKQNARARQLARRLGTLSESPEDSLFRLDVRDPIAESLGSIGRDMESLLVQAGSPYDMRGLFVRMGLVSTGAVLVLGLALQGPLAVGGILLGLGPVVVLNARAKKRAKALSEQLPDALDLVSRSLQAGHGLSDSMRLCAQEMPLPVSQEFGRVFDEHNLGRDLRESLTALSGRNPRNFDLKIFVSSVLLQRDTGGNLIEILDNISSTIRDRFVFKAKVKALTAEARISAIILGSLPILMLMLISFMRAEYLRPLWQEELGRIFLVLGGGLYLTGIVVMRMMSQVDT